MKSTTTDSTSLLPILQDIVLAHPQGLSEYELIKILQAPPYELFAQDEMQQPLALFQCHFVLFNGLYQLRDQLLQQQFGVLQIDCSKIVVHPWDVGQTGLHPQDKLREYYLDWENLNQTDQQQVEALLDSFWLRFAGAKNSPQNPHMSQQRAQQLLDLVTPYSAQQLKQQYRKMLHQHHPDKGGNNEHTGLLNQAFELLNQLTSKIRQN